MVTVLAAALATAPLVMPQTALASPFGVGHPHAARVAPATESTGSAVLGIEGENSSRAETLTTALRAQLSKRGETEAKDMTLAELKLTMGCDDGDLACIAQGGESLGVGELIYGKLDGASGEYTLTLTVLDVERAKVVNSLTTTVSDAELEGDALEPTAEALVVRLLGPADTSAATPAGGETSAPAGAGDDPTTSGDPGEEGPTQDDGGEPTDNGWGMERPPARWKVIGLGVSGGLMLASLGTAIGTTIVTQRPNGAVYKELVQEAENSLTDSNDRNDISPDSSGDLCELARAEPADQPGKVTNASMTKVCNKADALALTATATWIGTGVFAASTVAFTVLLFRHKPGSETARRMQRHKLSLGMAPRREGGFTLGGGFQF